MTNRLPGSKPSDDEGVTIGMDDINIVRVRLVKTNVRRVTLEERPSGVQPSDPAQVGQLLPHEPGDVGPEGEPDQVSVVVDGDPRWAPHRRGPQAQHQTRSRGRNHSRHPRHSTS